MTSALSLKKLIELMRDAAARTFDEGLRYHHEPDAVLYGKVVQLDALAECHYTAGTLTNEECRDLMSASQEIDRAFKHLAGRVFP